MKKLLSILLSFILILALPVQALESTPKTSSWATKEVARAEAASLLPDLGGADYTVNITRLQFARLAVSLVEGLGKTIEGTASFTDTSDIAAIKAAAAGIVKGVEEGTSFAPDSLISREEMATMLYRTIHYINGDVLSTGSDITGYEDVTLVSPWAYDAVGSIVGNQIMLGTSALTLSPKGTASIEQAILFVYRSYTLLMAAQTLPDAEGFADTEKKTQEELQKSYVEEDATATVFTDSRVNSLELVEIFNDIVNHPGTYMIFTTNYSVKAESPELVKLAGGLEMDSNGWMTLQTYLVFQSDENFKLLGAFQTEFSPDGNSTIFQSDFIQWLNEMKQ